ASHGVFTYSLHIPAGTPPGAHQVTADGITSGRSASGRFLVTPATGLPAWQHNFPRISPVRTSFGAATAAGRLYVIGGTDINTYPLARVQSYSPETGTWTTHAPMPTPRKLLAVTTGLDGRVYA